MLEIVSACDKCCVNPLVVNVRIQSDGEALTIVTHTSLAEVLLLLPVCTNDTSCSRIKLYVKTTELPIMP